MNDSEPRSSGNVSGGSLRSNPPLASQTPAKDQKGPIVSDILQGNFSEVHIPEIEIPGTAPLIFKEPKELLQEIWDSDEFAVNDIEEEFLLFPGEILDRKLRKQEGPHKHLQWRKTARGHLD